MRIVSLLCLTSTLLVVKAEELTGFWNRFVNVEDCPCVDVSSELASVSSKTCQLSNGEKGIKLGIEGQATCVPLSYGSSKCLQHDLIHDYNACSLNTINETVVPAYCFRPWCYVNSTICMKDSFERVYRSDSFPIDSGIGLFYSYSTCNSTADDWLEETSKDPLEGISIRANIPTYQVPMIYKRDINGTILYDVGDEYYNNSVIFEGVYPNFVAKLMKITNGDIANITYTHKSKASSLVHPTSPFSAAVQDIKDGLVDVSIGPFWITGQRLKMAAFTIPVVYDKTFLVVPRPNTKPSLHDQVVKVTAPFSLGVWMLLCLIILMASLLSVWFTDRVEVATNLLSDRRGTLGRMKNRLRRKKKAYARLALGSFLEKGTYFFSAGVDNDPAESLAHKVLMFGFGFFILITVSAYVANLAAFLTRSMDVVQSMDRAVAAGKIICAHPAVENELQIAWPKANFYFHQGGKEFIGMIEDYDRGLCDFLAVGWEDTSMNLKFTEMICDRNLAYTESLIIEMPVAFPVRSELASGFSYWMIQAQRLHGLSIPIEKKRYAEESSWIDSCDVQLSAEVNESSDDYAEITVGMMLFPLIFFACCAVIALIMHMFHQYVIKQGGKSLMGRAEDLELTTTKKRIGKKNTATRSLNTVSSGKCNTRFRNIRTCVRFKDEDNENISSEINWVDHKRDNVDDDYDDDGDDEYENEQEE